MGTITKPLTPRENAIKLKNNVLVNKLMEVVTDVQKTHDKDMLVYAMAHYQNALGSDKTKASEE